MKKSKKRQIGSIYLPFIIIIASSLILGAPSKAAGLTLSEQDSMRLIYLFILLLMLGTAALSHFKTHWKSSIAGSFIWIFIFFLIISLYSYRYEFKIFANRLLGELSPSTVITNENGSLSFRIASDGHYHIEAQVNSTPIRFILDTGASDVIIPLSMARPIGIEEANLNFVKPYQTANGQIFGAPIIIDSIQIGELTIHNVAASINPGKMGHALLGMSFLEKLNGYEVRNKTLTLWP